MKPDEKHSLMIKSENELHDHINSVVDEWESKTGIWVTSIKYFKNSNRKSMEINTAITLGIV